LGSFNATSLPTDVQEVLINERDFLGKIVRSEAAGDPGGGDDRTHRGRTELHERTASRTGHRNEYKPRTLTTRVGKLNLLVPQDREGTFSTKLFARYQRSEKALVLFLMEMYVQGVSTRRVAKIREGLCGPPLANPPSPPFPLDRTRSSRPGGSAPSLRPPTPTS